MEEDMLHLRNEVLPDVVGRLNKKFYSASAFAMRRQGDGILVSRDVVVNQAERGDDFPTNLIGVALRVSDGTELHTRYVDGIDSNLIARCANEMLAQIPFQENGLVFGPRPQEKGFLYEAPREIDPADVLLPDKIAMLQSLRTQALAEPEIGSARAIYRNIVTEEVYVDADRQLAQVLPMTRLLLFIGSRRGSAGEQYVLTRGGWGYEDLEVSLEAVTEAAGIARHLLDAVEKPRGRMDVILGSAYTGCFAHESFGHGREADTASFGLAQAMQFVGKQVGSELVTMYADPSVVCHGGYAFDHEGTLARDVGRVILVENGILTTDTMSDRASAHYTGLKETGHGRRESPFRHVYSRQSHTAVLPLPEGHPSAMTVEQMIASVQGVGMYIPQSSGGMEDPFGWTMQVNAPYGLLIRDGQLTGEIVSNVKLDGTVPELLKAVFAVGSVDGVHQGTCGKGHRHWVPVGDGGPAMYLKNVKVA
jgi:TldD protein